MTFLVPLMFFGWPFVSLFFFTKLKPHCAVLATVIGGVLFLPMANYNLPGLPAYSKVTVIAMSLVFAGRVSGKRRLFSYDFSKYDLPMILFCLCPVPTSIANGLGFYDGISGMLTQTLLWGVPYAAGRVYFKNTEALKDLCFYIILGGLLYVPLCLYEIRMSPQLSNMIYGIFPHSFAQHVRGGSYRPIVFMQHGLMISLWMAISTYVTFWFWRSNLIKHFNGLPISLCFWVMLLTTILCKSVNGFFVLFISCSLYLGSSVIKLRTSLLLVLYVIPLYLIFRLNNIITTDDVVLFVSKFVDSARSGSLEIRLVQEDLFIEKALLRPFLGWGGYGRGWPMDPDSGRKMVQMIDSLWLITFSSKGFLGLISLYSMMLVGPFQAVKFVKHKGKLNEWSTLCPLALALAVVFFMIDMLLNGMINSIYILISGALLGWYLEKKKASANQDKQT